VLLAILIAQGQFQRTLAKKLYQLPCTFDLRGASCMSYCAS
jgi:hypothetical protein